MSLQDNLNAVYNKKEYLQAEKQKIKQHDISLEVQLLENLHELQIDFIAENEKNLLLLPKTKRQLITEVLQTSSIPVNKKSKYADIKNQRVFLLKKYDTITNKTLRLAKIFDKMQEEKEYEPTQHDEIIELNKKQMKKNIINWETIKQFLLYILLVPFLGLYILLKIIDKK